MLVEIQSIQEARWDVAEFFGNLEQRGSRKSPLGGTLSTRLTDRSNGFRMVSNLDGRELMRIVGHEELEFAVFDLRITVHANIAAEDLEFDLFYYYLALAAANDLLAISWKGPPYSKTGEVFPVTWGRSLSDGSLILDLSLGAATIAAAFISYPKFSAGVKAAVSDVHNLRKWCLRALEKRRVFKDFNN